jgi:hypothetical protein
MERSEALSVLRGMTDPYDHPSISEYEREAIQYALTALDPPNKQGVKPGQVWQGWDVRERPTGGSRFRVENVTETHAHVADLNGKHPRKIKLTRMRPTSSGYRKLYD